MKVGYDSAETMLRDLASALTPHDFIGSYMAEREAAFHAQFKAWISLGARLKYAGIYGATRP